VPRWAATWCWPQHASSPRTAGPRLKARPARFFLPAIFAEGAVSDRLHLGIAALTAFGLGIHWPQDWVGREATIEASVQTFGINPAAGYRLTDRIGIGAGFQAVRATVDFTNALPAIVGGTVRVGGGTWGYGGNVALLVKVIPETLQLGLTYRSRVKLKFKGRADFDPNPEFASSVPDQGGKADLTLPDIITAGVMWRPTPRWRSASIPTSPCGPPTTAWCWTSTRPPTRCSSAASTRP
jgi:long-chain fatty acid transport protein